MPLRILALEFTQISSDCVMVQVPGRPKLKVPLKKEHYPQVPFLVNKKRIPIHTKLVAIEDKVIMRLKEKDAADKAAVEAAKKVALDEKKAEAGRAKRARTS